jgi:hypothetical protein
MRTAAHRRVGPRAAILSIPISLFFGFNAPANAANRLAPTDHELVVHAPAKTGQSFIQTEQRLPIRPAAIVTTDDGLIVAGYSGEHAWAAKTDFAGKVLWTYQVEKPAGYDAYPWLQVRPEFRCATAMPDGSVWLIGSTIEADTQVGLLSHLDRQGNVLEIRTAHPPSDRSSRAATNLLIDCVRMGDGIAMVGSTSVRAEATASRSTAAQPNPSPWRPAFWILILDANGHQSYEEVIPTGHERALGGSSAAMTLLAVGTDLIVSAQTGADTELLRLSINGDGKIQKHYASAFLSLIHPVVPDGRLQLLGTLLALDDHSPPRSTFSVALITLNDRLEELQRQRVPKPMVVNVVYRMRDQSLVVFGAEVHQSGERYTSQIARIDATLSHIRTLNPSRALVSDTGMIHTAAPLDSGGRFVAATPGVVKGYPDHPVHIDASPGFLRGAVLDFADLQ